MAELEKLGQKYRVALRYLLYYFTELHLWHYGGKFQDVEFYALNIFAFKQARVDLFSAFFSFLSQMLSLTGLLRILVLRDYPVLIKGPMLMTVLLKELLRYE